MNIEELVEAAQAEKEDGRAFDEICKRFANLVKKYAGQPHVAAIKDEAIAEGWLAVAMAVRTYRQAAGGRFAGYVESRVKYAIWNLFKRERRRWQTELPLSGGAEDEEGNERPGWLTALAAADSVEEAAESEWISEHIREALRGLPDKQRLAVVRTLLGGAQLADVATELGVSPQAIYGLRQRGLARLKTHLRGMY